jgi:hypothetical protein
MKRIWQFLRSRDNREIISWLGGGLVVLVGAAWTAFLYWEKSVPEPKPPGPTSPCRTPEEIVTYSGDFVFADSDTRLLELAENLKLSRCQMWIARNEIYARKGRLFKNEQLKRHFRQFEWYKPTAPYRRLNDIEIQNVELISQVEAR